MGKAAVKTVDNSVVRSRVQISVPAEIFFNEMSAKEYLLLTSLNKNLFEMF